MLRLLSWIVSNILTILSIHHKMLLNSLCLSLSKIYNITYLNHKPYAHTNLDCHKQTDHIIKIETPSNYYPDLRCISLIGLFMFINKGIRLTKLSVWRESDVKAIIASKTCSNCTNYIAFNVTDCQLSPLGTICYWQISLWGFLPTFHRLTLSC